MKMLHTLRNSPENTAYIETGEKYTVSEDGRFVSEKEYWKKYYNRPDFNYEWKNGYLEEKPMADVESSLVYQWFSDILRCYFSTYPVGTIVNLEIGFRLALPDKTSIRKPDLAIVLNDNPAVLNLTDCNYSGIFDICLESLSYSEKNEILRDTVEKKEEYEGIGVREYYILDARKKETAFYRLDRKGKYVKIKPEKGIVRSEVLEGFQFEIKDLYSQPSPEKLSEKETYRHYVLPFYSKAKLRAESEKLRAEQAEMKARSEKLRAEQAEVKAQSEKLRAEQAEQRAALLADRLRQLGISVE